MWVFYDYVKPKYDEKAKFCYMCWFRFIVYVKTDDIYKYIVEDVETRFDASNYELNRPLPIGKNKKVTGLMKDKLGEKLMTKFVGLWAKANSYLTNDGSEDRNPKDTNKYVIKIKPKFENDKKVLEAIQLDNKINYLEEIQINIDSFFVTKENIKNS